MARTQAAISTAKPMRKPLVLVPEPADILAMSETNPDGGGVSWWDGERLRVFKNVDPLKVVGFIYSHWDSLKRAPCLMHFRLATHGAVEPRNCHPFHTDRGYVAHNGIAYYYEDGPYASDSRNMIAAWIDRITPCLPARDL